MRYLGYTYIKKLFVVYLKSTFNWISVFQLTIPLRTLGGRRAQPGLGRNQCPWGLFLGRSLPTARSLPGRLGDGSSHASQSLCPTKDKPFTRFLGYLGGHCHVASDSSSQKQREKLWGKAWSPSLQSKAKHHLPSLETSGILLSFSPVLLAKGPARPSLPLRLHRSLRKREKVRQARVTAIQGQRGPGVEAEREGWEVGDGRGPSNF